MVKREVTLHAGTLNQLPSLLHLMCPGSLGRYPELQKESKYDGGV